MSSVNQSITITDNQHVNDINSKSTSLLPLDVSNDDIHIDNSSQHDSNNLTVADQLNQSSLINNTM